MLCLHFEPSATVAKYDGKMLGQKGGGGGGGGDFPIIPYRNCTFLTKFFLKTSKFPNKKGTFDVNLKVFTATLACTKRALFITKKGTFGPLFKFGPMPLLVNEYRLEIQFKKVQKVGNINNIPMVGSRLVECKLQALKYRSVTDIVRPIREIVRCREEATGHSVQHK
jgi:hypothetical protein